MKILYVANRSDVFSGGQISLLELLKGLDKTLISPLVLCPGEGELAERIRALGIEVLIWDMPSARTLNFLRIAGAAGTLKKIIRERDINIVHSNGSRAQFYSALAAGAAGAGLVWHVRESKKDLFLYDNFLAGRSDRIICVSEGTAKERFGAAAALSARIKVIYNGVDTNRFRKDKGRGIELRRKYGVLPEDTLLGIAGLLIPRKGHLTLIKAMGYLIEKYPSLKLIITGKTVDPGYSESLEKASEEKKVKGRVVFTGPCDDMISWLSAVDVFVLPSEGEGFSRVLLEAMSCSCPSIATDIPGNREAIVNGESGFLFPPGDAGSLAEGIECMLKDQEAAERMASSSRNRAEKEFSLGQYVNNVQNLYLEMLGAKE